MIREFQGKYRFLSNFWPCQVHLDGVQYPTVEHAYQAAKTLNKNERRRLSEDNLNPGSAKSLGRTLTIRPDWETVKLGVMYGLVYEKFQSEPLRSKLLNTGNEELQEGNYWNDTFWGICNGVGENNLGKIIMKVREEILEALEVEGWKAKEIFKN